MAIKSSQQRGLNGFDSESLLRAQGIRAVGGTITESGNYRIHTFTGSGQFTVIDPTLMVEYLIVAGGGSGGNCYGNSGTPGAGGGAGGVLTGMMTLAKQSYNITIGGGGTAQGTTGPAGNNGSNTTALGLTAIGGGGGGGDDLSSPYGGTIPDRRRGNAGGSGGGGSNQRPTVALGTRGQGSNGGSGDFVSGGGGASGIGLAGIGPQSGGSGSGGNGMQSIISGTATYYGGGGGGGNSVSYGGDSGNGGLGGGGKGGIHGGATATSGTANRGGGGGGTEANGGSTVRSSGAGGSGIVIIRYAKNQSSINENINVTDGVVLNLDASNDVSYPIRFTQTLTVEYLIVAGGGAGGGGSTKSPDGTANTGGGAGGCGNHGPGGSGGGGGAGGLVFGTTTLNINQTQSASPIVVGAGGTSVTNASGNRGTDSSAFGVTASGGGGGASYTGDGGNVSGTNRLSGGSGGGGDGPDNPDGFAGSGTTGQGYAGGRARNYTGPNYPGGGGGGAGNMGQDSQNGNDSGRGGNGLYYGDKFGTNFNASGWFSGGGGGGSSSPGGIGGGTTGGAGGGSGNGGSGIVCVRYFGAPKATGGTISTVNGYTVHTFTSSGTFTPTDTTRAGWNDISGYGSHAVLTGDIAYSPENGGTMLFDGVNDQILDIPTSHSHLSSSAIEVIFKPTTNNTRMSLGGYRHNGGYSNGTIGWLYIRENNQIWASVIAASQVYVVAQTTSTITLNQYHHVIFNKNTTTGLMEIYLNGVLSATANFDVATYAQWSSPGIYIGSNIIDIGKSFNTNSGQNWNLDFFKGNMGVFKLYNRVLTSTEVLQNYNSYKNKYGI